MITLLQTPSVQGVTANQISSLNSNFSNTVQLNYSNLIYQSTNSTFISQNVAFYSANVSYGPTFKMWEGKYIIQGANNVNTFSAHDITVTYSNSANTNNSYIFKGSYSGSTTGNTFGVNITSESNNYFSSNNLYLGTSSRTANGYSYLPNGILMQWGVVVMNTSSNNLIYFNIPFSSNNAVLNFTGNANNTSLHVRSINSTSANVTTGTLTSTKIFWHAIGF
jgi:hypothetical protein